jgi:hypothetical protein
LLWGAAGSSHFENQNENKNEGRRKNLNKKFSEFKFISEVL